jgi:hypothetical protein
MHLMVALDPVRASPPCSVWLDNDPGLGASPWINLTWEESGPQGNLFN